MTKKLSKEDRKFLLNLNVLNRNHLIGVSDKIFTLSLFFMSIIISICSLVISITTYMKTDPLIPLITIVILISLGLGTMFLIYRRASQLIEGTKKMQQRYEEHYSKLYPLEEYPELKRDII